LSTPTGEEKKIPNCTHRSKARDGVKCVCRFVVSLGRVLRGEGGWYTANVTTNNAGLLEILIFLCVLSPATYYEGDDQHEKEDACVFRGIRIDRSIGMTEKGENLQIPTIIPIRAPLDSPLQCSMPVLMRRGINKYGGGGNLTRENVLLVDEAVLPVRVVHKTNRKGRLPEG
jgi:hypothetical protein